MARTPSMQRAAQRIADAISKLSAAHAAAMNDEPLTMRTLVQEAEHETYMAKEEARIGSRYRSR